MRGEVVLDGLIDELRLIVREEVARALEIGGPVDRRYFNTAQVAEYLGIYTKEGKPSTDAINSMVKRDQLVPVRRRPRLLFTREELDRVATTEPEEWVA